MTVYSESFESGFGSWYNFVANTSDWIRNSGATSSSDTGPPAAYDGSYYIYVETSTGSSNAADSYDQIIYDFGEEQNGSVDFWFHQYGVDQGTLRLEAVINSGWVVLWSSSGDQGNQWLNVNVAFEAATKIRFVNVAAGGYHGDVALDLIVVTHEDPNVEVTYNFTVESLGVAVKSNLSASSEFIAETNEPYRGIRLSHPEVVLDSVPAALFSVNIPLQEALFEASFSQTTLIFVRLKQGINQCIANGTIQSLFSSNQKTIAVAISTVLSDSISKMQALQTELLLGDPTSKTQALSASIIDDYQKVQGLMSSVAGETTQLVQALRTLISEDGHSKQQSISTLIEAVFFAQKLQGVLSAIGDKTEPVIETAGTGDGTTSPDVLPPTETNGTGFFVANGEMSVYVSPDGSCSGDCTAGEFDFETESWSVPIEWTFPPSGKIDITSFRGVRHQTVNYKIYIDGKDVTGIAVKCDISLSMDNPHNEITIRFPMNEEWFFACDERELSGQPRIEIQFFSNSWEPTIFMQFLLEKRSLSGESGFSVTGRSLSAMDDDFREDIVFSLDDFASAKETAESLLVNNVVQWEIDDWLLPPSFEFSGKPFEGIMQIAQSAKAVVRAGFDNTVIIRPKFKVRPIEMPGAASDIVFDRGNILQPGYSQDLEKGKGYTAVEVNGYGSNISMPDIELEDSDLLISETAYLRVYWGSKKPGLLIGGESVSVEGDLLDHYLTAGQLSFLGEATNEFGYSEDADGKRTYRNYEFKNGKTSVERPISRIKYFKWIGRGPENPEEGVDYVFEENSREILSPTLQWGIANIAYESDYQRYSVHSHAIPALMVVFILSSDFSVSVDVIMKRFSSSSEPDPVWSEAIVDEMLTDENIAVAVGTAHLDNTRYDRFTRSFTAPYDPRCLDGEVAFVHNAELGCSGNHYIKSCNISFEGPKVTQSVEVFECLLL